MKDLKNLVSTVYLKELKAVITKIAALVPKSVSQSYVNRVLDKIPNHNGNILDFDEYDDDYARSHLVHRITDVLHASKIRRGDCFDALKSASKFFQQIDQVETFNKMIEEFQSSRKIPKRVTLLVEYGYDSYNAMVVHLDTTKIPHEFSCGVSHDPLPYIPEMGEQVYLGLATPHHFPSDCVVTRVSHNTIVVYDEDGDEYTVTRRIKRSTGFRPFAGLSKMVENA